MTPPAAGGLPALVAAEIGAPVAPAAAALAAAIAARHPTARAVLFYGSALREARLDGLMLDFYLIVGDYRTAFGSRALAWANRLLPPNVFPFEQDGIAAKYAVLEERHFARLASAATRDPAVWARFAQPARIAWAADDAARDAAALAIAHAAAALMLATRPCVPERIHALDLWREAFRLTYAAELRAERAGRAASVVDADPARYLAFTAPALEAAALRFDLVGDEVRFRATLRPAARRQGACDWARRRRRGKALTLARLAKASATFAGGIDYLAWKIGRHSGQPVPIRPWQRRWPILGALALLPRLIARGAVR